MGGGKAPKPPDYAAAAREQGAANIEAARVQAALNRVNQSGPGGTVRYIKDPNNPDTYTQETTLSPEQQALYNSTTQGQQQRLNLGNQALTSSGGRIARGLDTSGLPQRMSSAGPTDQQSNVNAGSVQYDNIDTTGMRGFERGGPVARYQRGVDFSGATALPGNEDFSSERQRVEDALYSRSASRLDDQFARREEDMRSQLLNRGLREGTAAYENAARDFNQGRTDAYGDLRDRAVAAGGQEQQRLFAQALAARQQGVGEELQQGQFANDASQLQNLYGLQRRQQAAAERGQQFTESERRAQFGNQAAQQNFSNELARAGFANEAQQQEFMQRLAEAQLNNQARDSGIQEQQIDQDQILQGLNFLYGGAYQQPTFGSGVDGAAGDVGAPDIFGAVNNQYGAQADVFNANQARRSGNIQAGVGAAATIAAAIF
jgi:hypothetical protein